GLSASLCHYASEMQTGEPDTAMPPPKTFRPWWAFTFLAVAASFAMTVWMAGPKRPAPITETRISDEELVAGFTGSRQCRWAKDSSSIQPRGRLRKGQQVELASGFAEITFDSGAQVLLQGPASLVVNSAWTAALIHGTLKANVPAE